MYGIPRPDWASDASAVASAASQVVVPEFKPKQGVKIETDPKVAEGGGRGRDGCCWRRAAQACGGRELSCWRQFRRLMLSAMLCCV